MDVLRLIKDADAHPKKTIRFLAWMNEENGVAGGRAYAEEHKKELPNHVVAIELDYGDGRPLVLRLAASGPRGEPLRSTLESIPAFAGRIREVSESPGTDLVPMSLAGVPTVSPLQEALHYFDFHHTAADTFDKVRKNDLRELVKSVASLAYAVAEQ
jgi:Zn-dependent M28 family amino/carboxypeptidase